MIERFIKNDLTLKRWRKFKSSKKVVVSCWVVIIVTFLSLTAEIWSNNKPVVMSYQGNLYFPVLKTYHPTEFGITDIFVMDYKNMKLSDSDWAIWPVNPWNPYESNKVVATYPSRPTNTNKMGTDDRGRDVLARILYGYRYSLAFALMVWFFTFILGILIGGVMGYAGGRVDIVGQRVVEVLSTVPQFFLLIILVTIFSPSMSLLVIISTAFGWIFISYYVRAEYLKLRNLDFVEASRAVGSRHKRIFFKHILPNALGPVLTFTPFVISTNVTNLAALDFLGFGMPPPTPSWGELLSQAEKHFTTSWWLAVYPSMALFLTLVLLNLIGEGLRDSFDPRK